MPLHLTNRLGARPHERIQNLPDRLRGRFPSATAVEAYWAEPSDSSFCLGASRNRKDLKPDGPIGRAHSVGLLSETKISGPIAPVIAEAAGLSANQVIVSLYPELF